MYICAKMNCEMFFILMFIFVSGSLSFTWSSNMNGILKSKSVMHGSMSSSVVESIATGVHAAMEHCKNSFKWDKWNCPDSTFSRKVKQMSTKEIAYTKAMISAAIVHAITRNCSKGEIKACGCDSKLSNASPLTNQNFSSTISDREMNPEMLRSMGMKDMSFNRQEWSWGGCSDDTTYAEEISKKYLDQMEKGSDAQAVIGRHNNRVGRQIVRDTMVRRCRCHGVSGSCSLQTCWMQVAPFSEISKKLKDRYKKASKVFFHNSNGAISTDNSAEVKSSERHIQSSEEKISEANKQTLLYFDDSPDYCLANSKLDWPGTKGRTCSRSNSESVSQEEKRSCRNVCRSCGHKVRKLKKTVAKKCNCTFVWCCEVKCDTCIENVEEYYCS